jgi:hypothetical protein
MVRKKENLIDILRGLTIPVAITVHALGACIIELILIVKIN